MATAGVDAGHTRENESSVYVKLTEVQSVKARDIEPLYTYSILYFSLHNAGEPRGEDVYRKTSVGRLGNIHEVIQRKQTLKRVHILHIYQKYEHEDRLSVTRFVPLTRTSSDEECINPCILLNKDMQISQCVVRRVLYEKDDMRISLDTVGTSSTGKSTPSFVRLSCEIEYDLSNVEKYYAQVHTKEKIMVRRLMKFSDAHGLGILEGSGHLDKLDPLNLMCFPCRKLYSLSEMQFDTSVKFVLKKKYDGFKGRLCVDTALDVFVQDDLNRFSVVSHEQHMTFSHDNVNVAYQVEFVEAKDRTPRMIFTDVIGVMVDRKLYVPEPLNVLDYFKRTPFMSNSMKLFDKTYRLQTQEVCLNSCLKGDLAVDTDGYLIVSDNLEFKYKVPTIDLVYRQYNLQMEKVNPFFHDSNGDDAGNDSPQITNESSIVNKVKLEEGGIYEVTLQKFNEWVVIRRRKDRYFASTPEQMAVFNREIGIFNQVHKRLSAMRNNR